MPELDYGIRDKRAAEDASLGARAARLAADCGGASFSRGTKVLLASGAAVPISRLKPGEKVLATNTKTGKTQAETVTAVLVHHDTDLYDLRVKVGTRSAVIGTTSNHLFWVPGTDGHAGRWIKAGALRYGTHLRNPNGATVTVTGGWMWDLTINADHDFYVGTVVAPVLVHNCGPEEFPNLEPENLGADEADAVFAGVTPAAPGTGAFDRTIASGEVKWAVTKGIGLRVMPTKVGGFEDLYHSVLSGGDSVLAAGTARIDMWEGGYYGRYITTTAGISSPRRKVSGSVFAPSEI